MKEYVLDANAVIRYFQNGAGAETVEKIIDRANRDQAHLSNSAVNLGEVLSTLAKSVGPDRTMVYIQALGQSVETVSMDEEFALAAAKIKYQHKPGYADSIAALLAIRRRGTLVTADSDFAKFGGQLKVLALPRHSA